MGSSEATNRLGSTLFLTALAHGVLILGVTFTGVVGGELDTSTLRVTLVSPLQRETSDDRADFIANQSQAGSSDDSDALRPTAMVSTYELARIEGDEQAAGLRDATPEPNRTAEQLTTSSVSGAAVPIDANPSERAAAAERARRLQRQLAPESLAAVVDLSAGLPANDNSDEPRGPNTVQSVLADYLNSWRERVERIGTLNFPREFLVGNSATGRPRLEVAIGADGSLRDIVVQSSSGDRAVDQAAVSILRLAAPFEPLPPAILAEYNPLRFAYEWDFIQSDR